MVHYNRKQACGHRHGPGRSRPNSASTASGSTAFTPGPVATDMGTGDMVRRARQGGWKRNPALNNMLTPFLPTYVAEPEDIADAVCWLASDESKLITAEALSVDQGSTKVLEQGPAQERHLVGGGLLETVVGRPHVEVVRTGSGAPLPWPVPRSWPLSRPARSGRSRRSGTAPGSATVWPPRRVRMPAICRPTAESISLRHVGPGQGGVALVRRRSKCQRAAAHGVGDQRHHRGAATARERRRGS